jgi:L-lactate dehydrogenase complex protein LldG
MTARDEVLARVRAAAAVGRVGPAPPRERAYAIASPLVGGALVARFAERAADYRAGVRRTAVVAEAIADILAEHGACTVAIPADLPAAWRPPTVELVPDDELSPQALDALDGVLTGSALAIAETGTIVLDGGPGQGRRALTLVPDLHVCVVEAARVVGSVPEAVAALGDGARGHRRPLTLVSGPSATSDIELTRVEGVHGPRRLEIVIAETALSPAPTDVPSPGAWPPTAGGSI